MKSGVPERHAVPVPLVEPVVLLIRRCQ